MIKKYLLIFMMCVAVSIPAIAKRTLSRAETDSVAQALTVIWGEHLKNRAERAGENPEKTAYLRGLREILMASADDSSYYAGLRDGAMLVAGIQQIEANNKLTVDRERMALAFERAAKGRSNGFTPQTAQRYMNYITTAVAADEKVLEESEKFLDEMEKKPGTKRGMSGLIWEKIKDGEGKQPRVGENDVVITYVGSLYDGKIFDETHRDRPVRFDLEALIPGFSSGLSLMTPGSVYKFYIPSFLAYGEAGVPGVIPPNAALVFEVTLHEVLPRSVNN